MKNKLNTIYVWACDIESYRGEGILGLNFLKHMSIVRRKKIYVESPTKKLIITNNKVKNINEIRSKKINFNFFYNYLFPIYGIFKIYVNSFKYKNICYLNFLPLWNFIIFLFLPKKTILGPITGSVYKSKIRDLNSLCRKYIIPILYNISLLIINKKKKLIFSTSILEKIVKSKKKQYNYFDYNLINFEQGKKIISSKDIDFLFYYRKYSAHGSNYQKKIIEKLTNYNFNIYVVGDEIENDKVRNLKIIDRKKLLKYLKRTKFTINEATNFYSIFCLDAISSGVKVFYDKKIKPSKFYFDKKYFTSINLENTKSTIPKIIKEFTKYKKLKYVKFDRLKFRKIYQNYFDENK